jgi:N-methylhydantoinase A
MIPTVTDANLLLGRLDPESFLGGGVRLDRERTAQIMREQMGPLATVEEFAAGILRVVETQMEKAIRVISVERGHDPRQFTLVAFGGGGPLHACSLARALRIPRVLIPAMPGVLSAVGILLADAVRDYSRTVMLPGDAMEGIGECFAELEQRGVKEFTAEGLQGVALRTTDMRYRRQGYELNVPYDPDASQEAIAAFHRLHQRRYGFCDVDRPVEVVNLRLRMVAAGEAYSPAQQEPVPGDGSAAYYAVKQVYFDGEFVPARLYRRDVLVPGDRVSGPAMIAEYSSVTVLPPDCRAEMDRFGNLVISFVEVCA